MNEYTFAVRETIAYTAYIEAESEEEARVKVEEQYSAGEFPSDYSDDVEFELEHVEPLLEPREMTFVRFEIFDTPALLTEMRRNEITGVPGLNKLYQYDLRHGDDDGIPLTVERRVVVNRYATIFTAEPLLADDEERKEIGDDDWGYCSDLDDCTPTEFLREMERKTPVPSPRVISAEQTRRLLTVLRDNGVDEDEVETVAEAVCFVLDLEACEAEADD